MDSEEESGDEVLATPPDMRAAANDAILQLLPEKSAQKYITAYEEFESWRSKNNAPISDNVMLAYFIELRTKVQPPTLWSRYSMLKATIKLYKKEDISKFDKLITYIKRQNEGYKAKKSSIFKAQEIEKFINEAPDEVYLDKKVALIVGVMGALRVSELANIKLHHLETHGDVMLVKIPETKTKIDKSFTIKDNFCAVVKKYSNLRPKQELQHNRFFVNYQKGACTVQPIGKNKFASMPKQIATYLNLPNPSNYTGHCFRRTGSSLCANAGADIQTMMSLGGWKSQGVAQTYIEHSLNYKKRTSDYIGSNITLKKPCSESSTSTSTSIMPPTSKSKDLNLPKPKGSKFRYKTPMFCNSFYSQNIPNPNNDTNVKQNEHSNREVENIVPVNENNNIEFIEDDFDKYIVEVEDVYSQSQSIVTTNNTLPNFNVDQINSKVNSKGVPNLNFINSTCNITFNINN